VAKPLLSNGIWEVIEPVLPPEKRRPRAGCAPVPGQAGLTGILPMLREADRPDTDVFTREPVEASSGVLHKPKRTGTSTAVSGSTSALSGVAGSVSLPASDGRELLRHP
jgi:hypothetical protein